MRLGSVHTGGRGQAAASSAVAQSLATSPDVVAGRRVAVVGASAAGLFAASLLAEHRVAVRVYEASPVFEPAPRTLIVTSRLRDVLGAVPEHIILNRVSHFDLQSRDVSARVSLLQPDLIVDRALLLSHLAERAQQAGAQLICDRRLVGIEESQASGSDVMHLRFVEPSTGRELREQADVLIGADGTHGQVSRESGQRSPERVSLLQARVPLPDDAEPDTVQVWFRPEETRFFYWLIPDGPERAALGLIADDAQQAWQRLQSFLSEQGLEPLEYQHAEVAQPRLAARPWSRGNGGKLRLTGDAAEHVKMSTVGGVVPGLRGAKATAYAVLGQNGHRREWRSLRRELDLHLLVRSLLDAFTDDDYNDLLAWLNAGIRGILGARARDDIAADFWKLPLVQPRLLALAARVVLREVRHGRR